MKASPPTAFRPLGTPRLPRRPFLPPVAVRAAQLCLVARIGLVVSLMLSAALNEAPTSVMLPGYGRLALPDGGTWRGLLPWLVAAAVLEAGMVLRLGRLRAGSRRAILFVESLVIAMSGLYTAAGVKVALVPLVSAIAAVVLLRLDHVRHSFNRAGAERRVLRQTIPAVLYEGYALRDLAEASNEVQSIGYRVGVDGGRAAPRGSQRSSA